MQSRLPQHANQHAISVWHAASACDEACSIGRGRARRRRRAIAGSGRLRFRGSWRVVLGQDRSRWSEKKTRVSFQFVGIYRTRSVFIMVLPLKIVTISAICVPSSIIAPDNSASRSLCPSFFMTFWASFCAFCSATKVANCPCDILVFGLNCRVCTITTFLV
jgi:hypothetical protein